MPRLIARKMLAYSTEELHDMLTGRFELVMDDGVVINTRARDCCYSSYAWKFHREFPNTPLLPKHLVTHVLDGNRLSSDTHLKLFGNVMWSVYDTYVQNCEREFNLSEIEFRDMLAEKIYRYINLLYNDLSYRAEPYVTSLDITDFIEVINEPSIKKANDELQPTQQSIDTAYDRITKALLNSEALNKNPLALADRSRLVKHKQVLQCVGPRGYLTDTDSNIFKKPILRGYVEGFRSFYDSLIESRSAAKSLIFSKAPLQQAEYFSRRLQLVSQFVQNLHMGDCGSNIYTHWTVRAPLVENGVTKRVGDLKLLVGKYYMDDDGVLKVISADDKHLIGRTLKLRTAIHCAHEDPNGICSTCFGDLSYSVPDNTNIGQMTCSHLAQNSSQLIISVKHYDGSSVVDGIILSKNDKRFLKVSQDENSYLMADDLKGKKVSLVIRADQAKNITDIMEVADVTTLNITRISEISDIGFALDIGSEIEIENIDVSLNKRLASMTYPLLQYIKNKGWGVDARGNYTVDMCDWDWSKEILTLPLRHFNMSDHSA